MSFPASRRAATLLGSHAVSSARRLQSVNLPPAEMSPFAVARDAEARLLQRAGVMECSPPPLGGELGHFDSPESDAKAVDYVHKLHDSFLLSKPVPPNPRQAAMQQNEEEEDVQEEDNIYVEMVRAKYKEMKRREKDNGIVTGITNRYAQQMRAKAAAAKSASKYKVRPTPSSSRSPIASTIVEEEGASATNSAPSLPEDPVAALRALEYRIAMLHSQLQHQQQATARHQRQPAAPQASQQWASVAALMASWRSWRTKTE